ncbi:hypothetical protein FEE95_00940 [Maribacter algarum]|uniref:Uncharacterized protein n=1 Tax=Maribacter algarum (ex Zhang et al. 2020) TaxID=2578118 RepID=A0A5S3PSU5_9FLAO|nr:hypothetical protein [Maribacter algarum]TMM58023.1 hypothetical protein FEE95_00940 [Maribacter algarum]
MKKKLKIGVILIFAALPGLIHPIVELNSTNDSIVYVWDFSVSDDSIRKIGNQLTNDFETELINSGLYTVLERRRYNRVMAHKNMETEMAEIRSLPLASLDSLRAFQAEVVIFGEVKDDIDSGEYEVIVTFQSLGEVILRKGSILIKRGLIRDNLTRKNAMKKLLDRLHAHELLAAKKEQYDQVSRVLATYMVRVKDVQKEFQDMANFAFDNQNYFNALAEKIEDYNEVFDDVHNNGATYHMNFSKHWNKPRSQELEAILSGILNDIHKTNILKLDKVRIAIGEYGRSTYSNSEKKKMREEILKDIKIITNDLDTQIDIMDLKINTFQSQLKIEMSG